jgi:site-specific DNA recombinase
MTVRRRCAIYTRKSSEEGLEQEFNSLHAQREACEAFIKSQQHEGWQGLRDRYDDGGLSGGTLERPALQRLLADVGEGKVDVVVVYKVDRLTRSLADFAKIVELFDAKGVSFVSVTQQFNTTSSMGRLTLNVLLSFAQFEREVTGERIRDKIAASKKKGLWMGGVVPLGYDLKDRALVVNPAEAETVRKLFRLYRELGTVKRLKKAADGQNLVTKRRRGPSGRVTGGSPFNRGHLYCLLRNPIYVGEVAHKGVRHPGRHEAIVPRDVFDIVQQQLAGNAPKRQTKANSKEPSLLTGLLYDETGDRLCPTHANKKGKRYRYYISKRLMHRTGSEKGGWRIPAKALEDLVLEVLRDFLHDHLQVTTALGLREAPPERSIRAIRQSEKLHGELESTSLDRKRELIQTLVSRGTLTPASIRLEIKPQALAGLGTGADAAPNGPMAPYVVTAPVELRRRGVEAKIVIRANDTERTKPDEALVRTIADALRWIDDLALGRATSLRDIARRNRRDVGEISRILPLAFLAPEIVAAILDGKQPIGLVPHRLKRMPMLSADWRTQSHQLRLRSA